MLRPIHILGIIGAIVCCADALAQSIYDQINRLRAAPTCNAPANLPPLRRNLALERVAAAQTRGEELGVSLRKAGYRATQSNAMRATGNASESELLASLEQRYCTQLTNPAVTEIGIYRQPGLLLAVVAAPFAPTVKDSQQAASEKILALFNQTRSVGHVCGKKPFMPAAPLRWNSALANAAARHAEDMAQHNYFSHEGRNGDTPAQRVERAGYHYRTTGENIAAGRDTPEQAVADWINSPSHCANLMNPAYAEVGAAYAINAASHMGVYWAASFGSRLE